MKDIIDSEFQDNTAKLLENVKWWERKRIWFNLIVGLAGTIPLFMNSTSIIAMNFVSGIVLMILFYGILANVFYTFGWVSDVLLSYYTKSRYSLQSYRLVLLVIGVLFSVILTFLLSYLFSLTLTHSFL